MIELGSIAAVELRGSAGLTGSCLVISFLHGRGDLSDLQSHRGLKRCHRSLSIHPSCCPPATCHLQVEGEREGRARSLSCILSTDLILICNHILRSKDFYCIVNQHWAARTMEA